MKTVSVNAFIVALILCTVSGCREKSPNPELLSIDLLRGDLQLCGIPEFGKVEFSLSCDYRTREDFQLGLALLHSFEYEEAEKAFVKVIDTDPECPMAYWGVAMSNYHALWKQSGEEYLEKGSRILKVAEKLPQSEKEHDYLAAIGVFYKDWQTLDHKTRVTLFEKQMKALYDKYKEDKEAAIFYALALCSTADPTDKTYSHQRKSGKILEGLLAAEPDHPGIAHYIIHNYDYPELAELALPVARRYAQIAPSSAHAQHMPSHIFTRLGLWEESINSNIKSTEAALCYSNSLNPNGHWGEELHGMDYLVYAYLQAGNTPKAIEQYDYLKSFREVFPVDFKIAYTAAAIPARIALENRDWEHAANLELPELLIDWQAFPWQKGIYHFARALGAIHLGDTASAVAEHQKLGEMRQQLLNSKLTYEANQVQVQQKAVEAWMALSRGDQKEALALMEESANMENSTSKHPVTPGEVLPAMELYGDLLMELKRPAEALIIYEGNLKTHPNRFNGLYGAFRAARDAENFEKARSYGEQLLSITVAGSNRAEPAEVKKYLGTLQTSI